MLVVGDPRLLSPPILSLSLRVEGQDLWDWSRPAVGHTSGYKFISKLPNIHPNVYYYNIAINTINSVWWSSSNVTEGQSVDQTIIPEVNPCESMLLWIKTSAKYNSGLTLNITAVIYTS